jgi:hypothetical protein
MARMQQANHDNFSDTHSADFCQQVQTNKGVRLSTVTLPLF